MSECKTDFWREFKEFLKREGVVDSDEDAEAYMSDFINRNYDVETLDNNLYHFCGFLDEIFSKLYGKELAKGLWFFYDIDYGEYKYNSVKAVRKVLLGKYDYDVEVNVYDCKWGIVAKSPEDFNKSVERFLKETKDRLENLLEAASNANFGRCWLSAHQNP